MVLEDTGDQMMKDGDHREEINVSLMSPEFPGRVGGEGTHAEPTGLPKLQQQSGECWEVKELKFSGDSMKDKMVGQAQGSGGLQEVPLESLSQGIRVQKNYQKGSGRCLLLAEDNFTWQCLETCRVIEAWRMRLPSSASRPGKLLNT